MKRQALPEAVEAALDTLSYTEDYAEALAAWAIITKYFRRYTWFHSLIGIIGLIFAASAAAIIMLDLGNAWSGPHLLTWGAWTAITAALGIPLFMKWNLDRYFDAENRWRQIAGTLAVRRP
jgi:hypothetical protein